MLSDELGHSITVGTLEQVAALPRVEYGDRYGLPHRPGTYFVFSAAGLLYVGMAWYSLQERWRRHHRREDFVRAGATYIAYAVALTDQEAYWTERHFRRTVRTDMNGRCYIGT